MEFNTSKMVYTKDDLKKFNTFILRTIPTEPRYDNLRKFVNDEIRSNLSNVIKRPVIPAYLQEKCAEGQKQQNNNICRATHKEQPARRKLVVLKDDTIADKINIKIRSLLSKLSEGNKVKLFSDFMKYDIIDECGQTLIDNIYNFSVDLDYIMHVYVDLILLLKNKNRNLYNQLIEKILQTVYKPLIFDDEKKSKRWRISNIKLISEIYCKDNNEITLQKIYEITDNFQKNINPKCPEYIELLCAMLKKIIPSIIHSQTKYINDLVNYLDPIGYNSEYEQRYRFMVQDVIEMCNIDEDD